MSMNKETATRFAAEWIDAWNSHELERILTHYTDDFEMYSPVITDMVGEGSGKLAGKESVAEYWSKALSRYPKLDFELLGGVSWC